MAWFCNDALREPDNFIFHQCRERAASHSATGALEAVCHLLRVIECAIDLKLRSVATSRGAAMQKFDR